MVQVETQLPQELDVLRDYGYSAAEEVFYAAQAVGPELAALTGIAPVELQSRLAPLMSLLPASQQEELEELPCSLGVPTVVIPDPLPLAAAGPVPPTPPSSVNHLGAMPPVRNQGARGTCVAHAAVAVLEHRYGADIDLSEQFLYWDCKQNDEVPTLPGTWIRIAFPLIDRDGVCPEDVWPYEPTPGPREDGGSPPAAAFAGALPYRHRIRALPKSSVLDIKAALASGVCVAISIPVYRSWYRSNWVRSTGKINMPLTNDILDGAHAVTLVGYEDSDERGTGGGRFIVRNSWGEEWAPNSEHAPGYGTLPYAYIERHGMEAYTLG